MIESREGKACAEEKGQVVFLAVCFVVESKHSIMDTLVLQKPHLRDTISSGRSQHI